MLERSELVIPETMGSRGQRDMVGIEVVSPTIHGRRTVKPINVAGCKDSSTSRRKRMTTPTVRETQDRSSIVDVLAASIEPTTKLSTFNRVTKKLQIMKRLSFLACGVPCTPIKKKQKPKKENMKITKTTLADIGDVDDSVRIRALFPDQSSPMPYLTLPKCGMYSRSPTPTRYDTSPDAVPSPMHSGSVRRCRQENLVKMMEKTLEDDKGKEEERSDPVITQRRTHTVVHHTSDPSREKRDQRHPRSRKIKAQRRRKVVHRRTATY